jgi:hypothetical protein
VSDGRLIRAHLAGSFAGANPVREGIYSSNQINFTKDAPVRRLFATIGAWLLHGGKKK